VSGWCERGELVSWLASGKSWLLLVACNGSGGGGGGGGTDTLRSGGLRVIDLRAPLACKW